MSEELKFLRKFTQKIRGGGQEEGGGGVGFAGVRVDVNAMLGVGGDVEYGGCEPRIEGIDNLQIGISRQSEEPKKIYVGIFEYILASMLKVFLNM